MTTTFSYAAHLFTQRFNADWSEETVTYGTLIATLEVPDNELRFEIPVWGYLDGTQLADHRLTYDGTQVYLSDENPTVIGQVHHSGGLTTDVMHFDIHVRSGEDLIGFDTVYVVMGGDPLPEFPSAESFQTWMMSVNSDDWWTPARSGPLASGTEVGWDDFDLPREIPGTVGNDRLVGTAGPESIFGGDGADTIIGDDGDDFLFGGATAADLRDLIYGGGGNDSIDGGYGNDELRGDAGNDTIEGGFGVDTVIGGDGDDVLTGSAWSDAIFGGNGADFINGGFGFDRVNGGAGADRFFHLGVQGHGSDWIQDYSAADGDVLQAGISGATPDQFQVNFANTANAGAAGVDEAFVIYIPTRQILWALVDGGGEAEINLQLGGQVFDLLN